MEEPVHIFLADDDADDRVVFYESIRLGASNAVLTIANNGKELLEKLASVRTVLPRLVFLDLNMPLVNGHEALVAIRSSEEFKTIPVFIYSTSENPLDVQQSFEEGADFFISKPDSFDELKSIIKAILALHRYTHVPPVCESFVLKAVEA